MKRLRHIFLPNTEGDIYEVIELVGSGLGINRDYNALWKRDEYYLIHLASGNRSINEFVTTFVNACFWLRSVKDLCDWTQPEESFQERHDLEMNVRIARLDILEVLF